MKKIGGILEGLILLSIGVYAALLVFFGDYWRFLNPKFKWLTAVAAVILLGLGGVASVYPNKRPKLSRIIIFLIMLRVIFVTYSGISITGHGAAGSRGARPDDGRPRITMNGKAYVKINLAELHLLFAENGNPKPARRYVVRGIVKRDTRLDRQGQFALVRNTVFCCLADSVGMGFRVQSDQVDKLADGQWVQVYGTVKEQPELLPDLGLRIKGINMTLLNESHILAADIVETTQAPEIAYIINIRNAEPYAY